MSEKRWQAAGREQAGLRHELRGGKMAKKAVTGSWRVNWHIMGVVISVLCVVTVVLMAVLCFWLFLSPTGDTGNDSVAYKAKEIGIEEILPDEEVMLGEPVAIWPEEDEDGPGEGDASQEEVVQYTYTELDMTLYAQTSLRVRDQPSIDGTKIGGLYRNQKVKATGMCNETGWYRIDFYGSVGYASNDYLAEEPVELDIPQSVGSFAAVEKSYFDNVLFIGDSLTVGLSMYGKLKNASYFCINGMGASEALGKSMDGVTLDALLDARQYDAVYIMLGINDMGSKRKSFLASYSSLVDHVQEKQPTAGIVIQSILAVTSAYTAEHPKINNDEIRERNASLAELADGEHIFYLDLNAYYIDEAGNLKDSQARDGLHLKSNAYGGWKDALLANGIVK